MRRSGRVCGAAALVVEVTLALLAAFGGNA
jgi:hypothetical protein